MSTWRFPLPWLVRKAGTSPALMMIDNARGGMATVAMDGAPAIDPDSSLGSVTEVTPGSVTEVTPGSVTEVTPGSVTEATSVTTCLALVGGILDVLPHAGGASSLGESSASASTGELEG